MTYRSLLLSVACATLLPAASLAIPDQAGFIRVDLLDTGGSVVEGHQSVGLDFAPGGSTGTGTPESLPGDIGPAIDLTVEEYVIGQSPESLDYLITEPGGGALFSTALTDPGLGDLRILVDDLVCDDPPCRLLRTFMLFSYADGSLQFFPMNDLSIVFTGTFDHPNPLTLDVRIPASQAAGTTDLVEILFGFNVPEAPVGAAAIALLTLGSMLRGARRAAARSR